MAEIESSLYMDLYAAPQNASYFNAPIKYLERLILSKQINLSKNPVLRWCFMNVTMYYDGNNNCKITKNKSKDSVDGAVALAMAVGLYLKINWDSLSMVLDGFTEDHIELDRIK